jgi:hypothetical protein
MAIEQKIQELHTKSIETQRLAQQEGLSEDLKKKFRETQLQLEQAIVSLEEQLPIGQIIRIDKDIIMQLWNNEIRVRHSGIQYYTDTDQACLKSIRLTGAQTITIPHLFLGKKQLCVTGTIDFHRNGHIASLYLYEYKPEKFTLSGRVVQADHIVLDENGDILEISTEHLVTVTLPTGQVVNTKNVIYSRSGNILSIELHYPRTVNLPDGTSANARGTIRFNEAEQIINIQQKTECTEGITVNLPAGLGKAKINEVTFNDAGQIIYVKWGKVPQHGLIYKTLILPSGEKIKTNWIKFNETGKIIDFVGMTSVQKKLYPDGFRQGKITLTKEEKAERQKIKAQEKAAREEWQKNRDKVSHEKNELFKYAEEIELTKYTGYHIIGQDNYGNMIYASKLINAVKDIVYAPDLTDLSSKKAELFSIKRYLDLKHPSRSRLASIWGDKKQLFACAEKIGLTEYAGYRKTGMDIFGNPIYETKLTELISNSANDYVSVSDAKREMQELRDGLRELAQTSSVVEGNTSKKTAEPVSSAAEALKFIQDRYKDGNLVNIGWMGLIKVLLPDRIDNYIKIQEAQNIIARAENPALETAQIKLEHAQQIETALQKDIAAYGLADNTEVQTILKNIRASVQALEKRLTF